MNYTSLNNIIPSDITWNTNGMSSVTLNGETVTIYSPYAAIYAKLNEYCVIASKNVWKLRHNDRLFFGDTQHCPLKFSIPQINIESLQIIQNDLQNIAIDLLENKLYSFVSSTNETESEPNIYHTMICGSHSDIHGYCSVCKTNNIIDPCILFPCEHTICSTCIDKLDNFYRDTNGKIVKCHECMSHVSSLFNTRNIIIPTDWKMELTDIAEKYRSTKLYMSDNMYVHF